jgi:hypothetical protein
MTAHNYYYLNRFMSTRVMSRDISLAPEHWLAVREVIQVENPDLKGHYLEKLVEAKVLGVSLCPNYPPPPPSGQH